MGVRVAYGKKGRISAAIASGTIPKDSLITVSYTHLTLPTT